MKLAKDVDYLVYSKQEIQEAFDWPERDDFSISFTFYRVTRMLDTNYRAKENYINKNKPLYKKVIESHAVVSSDLEYAIVATLRFIWQFLIDRCPNLLFLILCCLIIRFLCFLQ